MRIPHLADLGFSLERAQHHTLDNAIDTGLDAVHMVTRTLVSRSSLTERDSSTTTSCTGSASLCEKPVSASSGTLPIIVGTVVPLCCAIVVLIFLHRRHVRKQRLEDANDPHKSLDFGVDMTVPSKGGKGGKAETPEMTVTDLGTPMRPGKGHPRGLSMDEVIGSPYLLPAGLQGSRGSIHSMSRSMHDENDPYRPVAMLRTSQDSHRPRNDTGSMYSASSGNLSSNEKAGLMANAQRMSQSYPKRAESMSPQDSKSPDDFPTRQLHSNNRSAPSRKPLSGSSEQLLADVPKISPPTRKHSLPQSLPQPPPEPQPSVKQQNARQRSSSASASRASRKSSASAAASTKNSNPIRESSNYGDDIPAAPGMPVVNEPRDYFDIDPALISAGGSSDNAPAPALQQRPVLAQRMSSVMGLRPLPPDMPEDNPEVRANRIRSFYKEYFDDSKPNPAHGQYEEDYDAGYLDGAVFDPQTGAFVMAQPNRPFAQPVTRRAMTPPPRGAPRAADSHRRQHSTQSAGRGQFRGRPGPAPPMPKKRAPPPKPLQGLPTPYKLKDFESYGSSPIDFAPPTSFRATRNGSLPDSPTGVSRPYSPTVKAYSPLVGTNDDLAVIPSPHLLRKSGTFTSLDFAPPSRAWTGDAAGSDAGSIRSARSGISAAHLDAVRAGAYRVSRIPKDFVTTRDDLAHQLRPQMDMNRPY